MLACNRVTGRHTADNIMMWYEEIISALEKVKHIITDSASNVKKAFLFLPGYESGKKVIQQPVMIVRLKNQTQKCMMLAVMPIMNQKKANLAVFHLYIMLVLYMCYS